MPVDIESFSLTSLQQKLREAEQAKIERQTIHVRFQSPDDFTHSWTIENVDEAEELDQEIEGTIDAAKNRLETGTKKAGISNFEKAWNEILKGLKVDIPKELEEFMDLKEAQDDLEEAVGITQDVYEQVPRSRAISIQARVDQQTDSLQEYKDNLHKVDQNLEFEENVDTAWEAGRQRTTGELEFFTRDGTRMGALFFPHKVQIQAGGRGGNIVREFDDREEAREWYEQNRLG